MNKVNIQEKKIENQDDAKEFIGKRVGAARIPYNAYKFNHERDDIHIRTKRDSNVRVSAKPQSAGIDVGDIKFEIQIGIESPDKRMRGSPKNMSASDAVLTNVAADMSMIVFEDGIHLFHLLTWPGFRGRGYGKALIDIYVEFAEYLGVTYLSGFIGNGGTQKFLEKQGFKNAQFEQWTDDDWGNDTYSNKYWAFCDGVRPKFDIDDDYDSYWDLPKEYQQKYKPNTCDLANRFSSDAIQGTVGAGALRVRKDAAKEWWEGDWAVWFIDETKKVVSERDKRFPIINRRTPVLDRFRDPTFEFIR